MKRFINQAWLSFKIRYAAISFEEFLLLESLYPLITLAFYCILAAYSFNTNNLAKWVVGNSFLLCTNICIFALGSAFDEERYTGRIRSIIISPVSKLLIVLEKGFFPAIISVITVFFGFMIGSLIFNVDFTSINLWLFLFVIIVGMFSMTGFSLFLSSFGLITDSMHFILNLVANILIIFSGANFPITQLPQTLQVISKIIPLTRSIESANMLFGGYDTYKFVWLLLEEMLVGIIFYVISYFVIKIAEKTAKKNATLELF
ncbi:ABC transporter permease [Sedimentibacter hydroxybenzoicus DSM 7310]|uniref:ABC transporter permease n=1 Tax=Sedimentibacter hydroxybenzoicus DSM 7310 TaxID=1123245 RepID=A0A974GV34_SEDHY|nr:ABC transporter permease [Sedimentibacter hydroxybenzoicus]NYB72951.1 ABC transporter permease [Sedimentibacter hydroxybenzoicus DSM 7310]